MILPSNQFSPSCVCVCIYIWGREKDRKRQKEAGAIFRAVWLFLCAIDWPHTRQAVMSHLACDALPMEWSVGVCVGVHVCPCLCVGHPFVKSVGWERDVSNFCLWFALWVVWKAPNSQREELKKPLLPSLDDSDQRWCRIIVCISSLFVSLTPQSHVNTMKQAWWLEA